MLFWQLGNAAAVCILSFSRNTHVAFGLVLSRAGDTEPHTPGTGFLIVINKTLGTCSRRWPPAVTSITCDNSLRGGLP